MTRESEATVGRDTLRVPRQVLVYLYRCKGRDGELEFLLLRRTAERAGFWQGVSGAPEWEESDEQGAIREVREETGFDVSASLRRIGARFEIGRAEDPDGTRWERLYGPRVDSIPEEVYVAKAPSRTEPTLASDEHDMFRWCSFADARALLGWENNRLALIAAQAFIRLGGGCDGPAHANT